MVKYLKLNLHEDLFSVRHVDPIVIHMNMPHKRAKENKEIAKINHLSFFHGQNLSKFNGHLHETGKLTITISYI